MTPVLVLETVLRRGSLPAAVQLPASDETWGLQHAVARLLKALRGTAFGLDHALLLRQCLRLLPPRQPMVVESIAQAIREHLSSAGITQHVDGTVETVPYQPLWLTSPAPEGVDVPARQRVVEEEPIPGEAWLERRLGKRGWRSQAQREAAWSALTAPANSTLLVGLPTGAGKSLVYQVCAVFEPGLTVVVVPTVALGLDQIKALGTMPLANDLGPQLYAADEKALQVVEAVRSRACRLLITSPEAIVAGRLGSVLSRLAQEGWLRRLVIDEAHIVESWGASFRIEFQLLGAQLRSWRQSSPTGVRALLLSATFGEATPKVLRKLFCDDDTPWSEYVIQRLRPEIHYFSPGRALGEEEKIAAVTEAVLRLPRPLVLYVTERNDAERWYAQLRDLKLQRLACFHGNTPSHERDRILQAWREDDIDVVVATSAFGMGVDKADVRAIVHACFPENLDRFYQEVGRGGRDGAASVSVALWTFKDHRTGIRMGPKLLTDERKIRERWEAMWHGNETDQATGIFKLHVGAEPNYRMHERSYDESVAWNKRLLMMMERAAILRVRGLELLRDEMDGNAQQEWATVQMLCPTPGLADRLADLLAQVRIAEAKVLRASRRRLEELLLGRASACRILRSHYGAYTYRACGSCAICRSEPDLAVDAAPLRLLMQQDEGRPTVDVVRGPSLNQSKGEAEVLLALRRVMSEGLCRRFVAGERFIDTVRRLLERAGERGDAPYRLDLPTGDVAKSVRADELVICLHAQSIDPQATLLHSRGALCTHWVLGAAVDDSGGRWPFLHEKQSRLFTGRDALNDWIYSRLQLRHQPTTQF